MRAIAGRCLW
jgi:hypothetical protein